MTPRQNPTPRAGPAPSIAPADRAPDHDRRWNEQVQGLLRDAAETRADLDRSRSLEDARATEREATSLQALIEAHKPTGDR